VKQVLSEVEVLLTFASMRKFKRLVLIEFSIYGVKLDRSWIV